MNRAIAPSSCGELTAPTPNQYSVVENSPLLRDLNSSSNTLSQSALTVDPNLLKKDLQLRLDHYDVGLSSKLDRPDVTEIDSFPIHKERQVESSRKPIPQERRLGVISANSSQLQKQRLCGGDYRKGPSLKQRARQRRDAITVDSLEIQKEKLKSRSICRRRGQGVGFDLNAQQTQFMSHRMSALRETRRCSDREIHHAKKTVSVRSKKDNRNPDSFLLDYENEDGHNSNDRVTANASFAEAEFGSNGTNTTASCTSCTWSTSVPLTVQPAAAVSCDKSPPRRQTNRGSEDNSALLEMKLRAECKNLLDDDDTQAVFTGNDTNQATSPFQETDQSSIQIPFVEGSSPQQQKTPSFLVQIENSDGVSQQQEIHFPAFEVSNTQRQKTLPFVVQIENSDSASQQQAIHYPEFDASHPQQQRRPPLLLQSENSDSVSQQQEIHFPAFEANNSQQQKAPERSQNSDSDSQQEARFAFGFATEQYDNCPRRLDRSSPRVAHYEENGKGVDFCFRPSVGLTSVAVSPRRYKPKHSSASFKSAFSGRLPPIVRWNQEEEEKNEADIEAQMNVLPSQGGKTSGSMTLSQQSRRTSSPKRIAHRRQRAQSQENPISELLKKNAERKKNDAGRIRPPTPPKRKPKLCIRNKGPPGLDSNSIDNSTPERLRLFDELQQQVDNRNRNRNRNCHSLPIPSSGADCSRMNWLQDVKKAAASQQRRKREKHAYSARLTQQLSESNQPPHSNHPCLQELVNNIQKNQNSNSRTQAEKEPTVPLSHRGCPGGKTHSAYDSASSSDSESNLSPGTTAAVVERISPRPSRRTGPPSPRRSRIPPPRRSPKSNTKTPQLLRLPPPPSAWVPPTDWEAF